MKFSFLKYNNLIVFLGLLLVAFLVYFPIIDFHFFQDDYVWISQSKIMQSDFGQIMNFKLSNFLMPVINIYFIITEIIFGSNPSFYHITSIFIHALNSFLLYILIYKMFQKKDIAVISSFIFLVARYQMEAVVWISAITILLSTLFILLAIIFWLDFLKTKKKSKYILFLIFTILSIFTKEWSSLLPLFVLITTILYYRNNLKYIIQKFKYFLLLALPVIFIFSVYFILEHSLQTGESPLIRLGYYSIGIHFFNNLTGNILALFLPYLTFIRENLLLWNYAGIIFTFTLLAFTYVYYLKTKSIVPIMCFLWIVIAFLPTSFFTWFPFVSRYAYLPSIGMVLLLAYLIVKIANKYSFHRNKILIALTTVVMIGNIYLLNSKLNNHYKPAYDGNKNYAHAISEIKNTFPKNKSLYIYNDNPIKGFILPEFMHSLFDYPKNNVKVLEKKEKCPDDGFCIRWSHDKQKVLKVK